MARQRNWWVDALARLTTRQPGEGVPASPPSGPWQEIEIWRTWFCTALIATAVFAAYVNSLSTPFVFDDIPNIVDNPAVRSLWPFWQPAGATPAEKGLATTGRPVVRFSLALNHALGGSDVRGYHVVNLLIHFGAALALFGLVRRTLELAWAPEWLRGSARSLGLATALLWAVHPLQTESVTCIIQRTESLAGLLYLTTLYCFVRGSTPGAGAGSPSTGSGHSSPENMACHERRPGAGVEWLSLSLAACYVGVATKETVATVPLLLLLYDRTFIAGAFREAWKQRPWFHGLMVLSWVPLALLMAQTGNRGGTVMIDRGVTAWMSLITQGKAITGYLQLVFWPHPLVIDYGDFVMEVESGLAAVWPQFVFVSVLVLATAVALVRWPRWGFPGAWFFLILGPSSSFIPLLSQVRAEHRMYLPLAAVVWLVVLLIHRTAGRAAPVVVLVLATALGVVTAARNNDYESGMTLWSDTVRNHPGNPRAHYSLGLEYYREGDWAATIREFRETVRMVPGYLAAQLSLAGVLLDEDRVAEARPHLEAAIQLHPQTADDNVILGRLLVQAGEPARAMPFLEAALRLDPGDKTAAELLRTIRHKP